MRASNKVVEWKVDLAKPLVKSHKLNSVKTTDKYPGIMDKSGAICSVKNLVDDIKSKLQIKIVDIVCNFHNFYHNCLPNLTCFPDLPLLTWKIMYLKSRSMKHTSAFYVFQSIIFICHTVLLPFLVLFLSSIANFIFYTIVKIYTFNLTLISFFFWILLLRALLRFLSLAWRCLLSFCWILLLLKQSRFLRLTRHCLLSFSWILLLLRLSKFLRLNWCCLCLSTESCFALNCSDFYFYQDVAYFPSAESFFCLYY